MGLVVAALALAITGCYAPSLRDCVVTCAAADECATGQTCSGGLCAAAGASCAPSDAATPADDATAPADAAAAHDARPADAAPAIDATPPPAQLHVMIMGTGQITVDGVGTCIGGTPGNTGNCSYSVVTGTQETAQAMVVDSDHPFDKWVDPLCMPQGATCMFTVVPITTIQAHFK